MKKIKIISVLLALIFAVAFAGCDNIELAAYKITAKAAIETYAQSKGEYNYTEENWETIGRLVIEGKAKVDAAVDKPAVETAVDTTKQAIDEVSKEKNEMGETSLHKHSDTAISTELEHKIRQAYVRYRDGGVDFADVYIPKYYGTYSQASVITILVDGEGIGNAVWSETVAGITFFDSSYVPIRVMFEDVFYSLQQSYENGFLSLTDLQNVATHQVNDDKIPDPGGEFDYATVLVILSDESASIDKEWVPADFIGFAFSKIDNGFYVGETYTKYDGGYLVFHLTEPSRDNVLRAIYYLITRPEIKSASPNHIDTVNDL